MDRLDELDDIVIRARAGSLEAYGRLVQSTQRMAYAVALRVVQDRSLAEDATQEAYLRAFRRLGDLDHPAAFIPWLRRIVITVALNARRRRRVTLLRLDDVPDVRGVPSRVMTPLSKESAREWPSLVTGGSRRSG